MSVLLKITRWEVRPSRDSKKPVTLVLTNTDPDRDHALEGLEFDFTCADALAIGNALQFMGNKCAS